MIDHQKDCHDRRTKAISEKATSTELFQRGENYLFCTYDLTDQYNVKENTMRLQH